MNRTRFALLVAVPIVGAAIAVACAFPSPSFQAVDGGGPDSSGGDTGGNDGGSDAPAKFDGADPDALVSKDAGGKIDAADCTADASACDCDGDGFRDEKKAACKIDASLDCDDTDTRYRPDQKLNFEPPEAPRNGDWNCDGRVDTLYKPSVSCKNTAPGVECDSAFGFTDAPKCGDTGRYVECKTVCGLPIIGCECREGPADLTHRQACN